MNNSQTSVITNKTSTSTTPSITKTPNDSMQLQPSSAPPKQYSSVKDIGFAEDMNQRHRRTMEDGHYIKDRFGEKEGCGFFAIYDGHGGTQAVEHVQENLHKILLSELEKTNDVNKAIAAAYKQVDDELKNKQIMYNGTTAVTCLIRNEDGVRKMYVSNAGDARIVISHKGKAERLTRDHKASDEEEATRIKSTGGFVAYNRVNGILSVTRALGDHAMKEWVLGEPYQKVIELKENEYEFVILACDGLWDVFTDQEAIDFAKDYPNAQECSQKLVKMALEKGSTDNISVMVLRL